MKKNNTQQLSTIFCRLKKSLVIASLATIAVPNISYAENADRQAHIDIIEKFKIAFETRNGDILNNVYSEDAMFFTRRGDEYFGKQAVINGLIPPTTEPVKKPDNPPAIVIDDMEVGEKRGYIYGRVCGAADNASSCHTRWFLVTEKDDKGQWHVQADLDLPHKANQ